MEDKVPIPPMMAGRPVYQGLAVPYTTLVAEDGTPDFKVQDETKRIECLKHRKCGLCGQLLGDVVVFVGGSKCCDTRLYFDAPGHEECVLYATKACPFLAKGTGYSKSLKNADVVVDVVSDKRPKVMALYYTKSFWPVRLGNHIAIKVGDPVKIDYGQMPVFDDDPDGTAKALSDLVSKMFGARQG